MASFNTPIGLASKGLATNASLNACLGRIYVQDGLILKLVKTSAALASIAKQAALDAGSTTFTNTIATVTAGATHRFLGLFPVGQVDLASGDYCMVVCGGMTTAVCGAATTAGNALITAATGRLTNDSGTYSAATCAQAVAFALQTQTTGNDVAVQVAYRG
jgi:hypothetical protein